MARKLSEYKEKFDWVKVRSRRKVNFGKLEWTNRNNFPLREGEEAIVARDGRGMPYYFNNGFFDVLDENPDVGNSGKTSESSAPEEADDEETVEEPEMSYSELRKWASDHEDEELKGNLSKERLEKEYKQRNGEQ